MKIGYSLKLCLPCSLKILWYLALRVLTSQICSGQCWYYWWRRLKGAEVYKFYGGPSFSWRIIRIRCKELLIWKYNCFQGWRWFSLYCTYQSCYSMQSVGPQQACLVFNFCCSSAELILINWSRGLWAATILKYSQQVACMCTALCQWHHQVTDLLSAHSDLS